MIYLASYHPLLETPAGREAITRYGLLPFVEGSCRREPDLEHEWPAITSLGRGPRFAPKLQVGDIAVFVASKADYLAWGQAHWRLTAILEVCERLEDHEAGAEWYRSRDLPLPSNCLVHANEPLPMENTIGVCTIDGKKKRPLWVDEWDEQFQEQARKNPDFLICKPLFRELSRPPIISMRDAVDLFGPKGLPPTLTPPELSEETYEAIKKACRITVS